MKSSQASVSSAGIFGLSSSTYHVKKVSVLSRREESPDENRTFCNSPEDLVEALHQKIKNARKRRAEMQDSIFSQPLAEIVPENRDALLQRYRGSNGSRSKVSISSKVPTVARGRSNGRIPSYKKDAMKLIVQRIQRYMIDVFRDLERHASNESIQSLQRFDYN